MSPARIAAYDALLDAERRGDFADRRLRARFAEREMSREDRALATLLVQETNRRRGALDYVLGRLLERGLDGMPVDVLTALRIGLLQLLHLDRVPAHAAVDESVELVKRTGRETFVGVANAVLRRAAGGDVPELPEGDSDKALAARHSFPAWLVRRWRRLGPRLEDALCGSNRTPEIVLRVNTLRTTADAVRRDLGGLGIETAPGRYHAGSVRILGGADVSSYRGLIEGYVSVQDESESLVGRIVDPLPGERVLDLCAAPGGKSTHLLELSRGLIDLTCADASPDRIRTVNENLVRLGVAASLVVSDGRMPAFDERFERVLVDAPCTGTGVLARRAEARWRLSSDDPARLAELQLALLDRATDLVKLGGVLVYSVCSIEPEETDDVVERLLALRPDLTEEPITTVPDGALDEGRLRLLPGDGDGDGVFGVRFKRGVA